MRRLTDDELRDVIARTKAEKCTECNGKGETQAEFTRGIVVCADCEGTGNFALSTEVALAAFEELLTIRSKMLTGEEGTALERLVAEMWRVTGVGALEYDDVVLVRQAINKLLGIERKEQG